MWVTTISWTTIGGLLSGTIQAQSEQVADDAGVGEANSVSKANMMLHGEFKRLATEGSGSIDFESLQYTTQEV